LETDLDDERRKLFAKFGFAIRSQQALEFYRQQAFEYHSKINEGSMPFLEELLRIPLSDKEVMPESYNVDDKCRLKIAASAP
jgi:phenylacetate-coenzyme A ligase PaaK-like adenylate-forming protein